MQRLLGIVAAVVVVGLLYVSLTALVPLTGLEGVLLLCLLISVAAGTRRRRRYGFDRGPEGEVKPRRDLGSNTTG